MVKDKKKIKAEYMLEVQDFGISPVVRSLQTVQGGKCLHYFMGFFYYFFLLEREHEHM